MSQIREPSLPRLTGFSVISSTEPAIWLICCILNSSTESLNSVTDPLRFAWPAADKINVEIHQHQFCIRSHIQPGNWSAVGIFFVLQYHQPITPVMTRDGCCLFKFFTAPANSISVSILITYVGTVLCIKQKIVVRVPAKDFFIDTFIMFYALRSHCRQLTPTEIQVLKLFSILSFYTDGYHFIVPLQSSLWR